MDSIADEAKLSSRPEGKKNRGAPVPDLLEEAWFFRKFIDGTTAAAAAGGGGSSKPAVRSMGRCFSDPTSSQSVTHAAPPPQSGGLARAPSLPPPCVGRRSGEVGCCRKSAGRSKVGDFKTGGGGREEMMMKRGKRGSRSEKGRNPGSLERAPSLPPWIGRSEEEVEEDDESDMSMSRLIQQAMSCSLDDISVPKPTISSASKMNSRIAHSSTMKTDVKDGSNYSRRRIIPVSNDVVANSSQTKSVSDVHQGRKLKKTLSNLEIPRQRPNNNNGCSPPIPTWAEDPNAHMSENIKAHLKVWARSVAANIH